MENPNQSVAQSGGTATAAASLSVTPAEPAARVARVVLTEADAAADLAGLPRPDNQGRSRFDDLDWYLVKNIVNSGGEEITGNSVIPGSIPQVTWVEWVRGLKSVRSGDAIMSYMSAFARAARWLSIAGKNVGDQEFVNCQFGVFLEEISEALSTVSIRSGTGLTHSTLEEISFILRGVANTLKAGGADVVVENRAELLDGLCDIEFSGNGLAFALGMNKPVGDIRTRDSNDSKFNPDGTPVILPGGKVGKADGWAPAVYDDLV